MKVAVLCPSRGRPKLAREMQDSFPDECVVWFYLNEDDPELKNYKTQLKRDKNGLFPAFIGPDAPIAYSTNWLWRQIGADAYIFCGDDALCQSPNLIESLEIGSAAYADGIWAAGFNDSRGKQSFPHPCISQRWTDILGYVVPPIFFHWHIDTYTEKLARRINRFIDLSDTATLEHRTCKTGKTPADETHHRVRKGVWRQRDAYVASFERYLEADAELLRKHL